MIRVNFLFSQPVPKRLISLLQILFTVFVVVILIFLKTDSQNESTQKDDFERGLCSQTRWLCIIEMFYMF